MIVTIPFVPIVNDLTQAKAIHISLLYGIFDLSRSPLLGFRFLTSHLLLTQLFQLWRKVFRLNLYCDLFVVAHHLDAQFLVSVQALLQ